MNDKPMTPWVRQQLRDATTLAEKTRMRSAMDYVLRVLSVYPENASALKIAAGFLYLGFKGEFQRTAKEPLTLRYFNDPRLDCLYCECETEGCTACWLSYKAIMPTANVHGFSAAGGRCHGCAQYICKNHVLRTTGSGGTVVLLCPKCRRTLDPNPEPNGRGQRQTIRLNQPLVHVLVLREGPLPPEEAFLNVLFENMLPDVLEDQPSLDVRGVSSWPKDIDAYCDIVLRRSQKHYLSRQHDVYYFNGRRQDGVRWAVAKVYASMAKWLDPDDKHIDTGGALFWFHWPTISDAGNPMYGKFVYRQLLPQFAPQDPLTVDTYFLFDGDCLAETDLHIPYSSADEERCLSAVVAGGSHNCYVVAVYGIGELDFNQIDRTLRKGQTLGYLGKTSIPSGFDDFERLVDAMGLVFSLQFVGPEVEKASFSFMTDGELEKLGFHPTELRVEHEGSIDGHPPSRLGSENKCVVSIGDLCAEFGRNVAEDRQISAVLRNAITLARSDKWDEAAMIFSEALNEQSDYDVPHLWLADYVHQKQGPSTAVNALREAARKCRRKSNLLQQAAELSLLQCGQVRKAVHLFVQSIAAMETKPRVDEITYQRACLFMKQIFIAFADHLGAEWADGMQHTTRLETSLITKINDALETISVDDKDALLIELPEIRNFLRTSFPVP